MHLLDGVLRPSPEAEPNERPRRVTAYSMHPEIQTTCSAHLQSTGSIDDNTSPQDSRGQG